jgi:hypothetical protein
MWWGIGFGAVLYVVLLVTLGVMTLRNGHGWLFFFGIFFPLLWIIGAIMGRLASTPERRRVDPFSNGHSAGPSKQRLARLHRPATMDERGQRLGSCFRLSPCKPRQAGEHGVRLFETDVGTSAQ